MEQKIELSQVTESLSACLEVVKGTSAQRILELADKLPIGKMILHGIIIGDLVIVPKSAIQAPAQKKARSKNA